MGRDLLWITNGLWSSTKKQLHINCLELKAVFLIQIDNAQSIIHVSHSHLAARNISGKSFKEQAFRGHCRHYHCFLASRHITSILCLLAEVGCFFVLKDKRSPFAVSTNCARISANFSQLWPELQQRKYSEICINKYVIIVSNGNHIINCVSGCFHKITSIFDCIIYNIGTCCCCSGLF